ncbi:MAG: glycosyltransferase family 2 protein [Candidatus Aenigmarchaeota archaeon]|nr:glycosyltransferase family 2 protein [Candidatus Aenigmarchaeota archaeon]
MVVIVSAFIALSVLFIVLSVRADRKIRALPLKTQSNYPLVSVIIPTFKTGKGLEKTLSSIKLSNYPKKEVVVVNDGFDQHIKSVCKKFGAKLIQNKTRLGKGFSINKGVKHSTGDHLVFLDSDTLLGKNTLTTLFNSYMTYQDSGDKIGMISPSYNARNKKNIFSRFVDLEQSIHQNIIKIQMNFKSILSIRGCCLFTTKNVFNKTGGFSKTLIEDGDFAARVLNAGYNIKYEPRASVKTSEPESFSSLLKSKRRYGKGTFYCLLKNKKPFIASPQAAICFYPTIILVMAFIGLYLFQNFVYTVPLLLFLTTISINGSFSFLYTAIAIVIITAVGSMLNGVFSYQAAGTGLSTSLTSLAIFSVLFIPVMYAYSRGAISGMIDKIKNKPELVFDDW